MFKGFSPRSSELFWELGFNNNREWFRENRGALDTYLLVPFRELAEDTFALFREKVPAMDPVLHVSRIYRDARRLFGRGPYKDNLWFSIRSGGTTGDEVSFFFEITPSGWCYGMGFWSSSAALMENFRRSIDAFPDRFRTLAEQTAACSEFVLEGESYKRPKGDYDGIVGQWYNHRWNNLICRRDLEGDAFTPELPSILVDGFCKLLPMFEYLDNVAHTVEKPDVD